MRWRIALPLGVDEKLGNPEREVAEKALVTKDFADIRQPFGRLKDGPISDSFLTYFYDSCVIPLYQPLHDLPDIKAGMSKLFPALSRPSIADVDQARRSSCLERRRRYVNILSSCCHSRYPMRHKHIAPRTTYCQTLYQGRLSPCFISRTNL
jgi:hypothetical protein